MDGSAARMDQLKIDLRILHKWFDNEELGVEKDFMRLNTDVTNHHRDIDITADIDGIHSTVETSLSILT